MKSKIKQDELFFCSLKADIVLLSAPEIIFSMLSSSDLKEKRKKWQHFPRKNDKKTNKNEKNENKMTLSQVLVHDSRTCGKISHSTSVSRMFSIVSKCLFAN